MMHEELDTIHGLWILYNKEEKPVDEADIFSFQLGEYFGYYHVSDIYEEGNIVRIGCEYYSLDWWLENYREMGKEAQLSAKEIRNYGRLLKTLKEME